MAPSASGDSFFGMPAISNHHLPPNMLAFTQTDRGGEETTTLLRFDRKEEDEKADSRIRKGDWKLSSAVSYSAKFEVQPEDLSVLSLNIDEELRQMADRRFRQAEQRLLQDILMSGDASSTPWGAATTCVAPDKPSVSAEEIIAAMEEMADKLAENDAKLYAALLAAGIEIRVSDIIDKDTPIIGIVLFIPSHKKRALQMAYEQRAKEVRYEKAATNRTDYGAGFFNSVLMS